MIDNNDRTDGEEITVDPNDIHVSTPSEHANIPELPEYYEILPQSGLVNKDPEIMDLLGDRIQEMKDNSGQLLYVYDSVLGGFIVQHIDNDENEFWYHIGIKWLTRSTECWEEAGYEIEWLDVDFMARQVHEMTREIGDGEDVRSENL